MNEPKIAISVYIEHGGFGFVTLFCCLFATNSIVTSINMLEGSSSAANVMPGNVSATVNLSYHLFYVFNSFVDAYPRE